MGYKKVCFSCRKAFSLGNDLAMISPGKKCPECGNEASLLNHKFRPPKQSDSKAWELAEYLVGHGFMFDHQSKWIARGTYIDVPYPTTMEEAVHFVAAFKK